MGAKPPSLLLAVGTRYIVSLLLMLLFLTSCAVYRTENIIKIALLTSFEGRYREIGYNALYAAQLALQDNQATHIHLLSVDDGGSIESAVSRAQALRRDSAVKMVLVMGIFSTHATVQRALGDIPVLIVGHWNATPISQNIFMLASSEIANIVTLATDFAVTDSLPPNVIGSEILALAQIPKLHTALENITIISSGTLPDADFREQYLNMGLFVPEPGVWATLTYDAVALTLQAIQTETSLSAITYSGINGTIRFENGYWYNAPIYRYRYVGAQLTLIK